MSSLAKKIGCRSKSYPREVMTGRRALSLAYAAPFAEAFGLKGEGKKLFLKMADLERSEVAAQKMKIQGEILRIKSRMRLRLSDSPFGPSARFKQSSWIDIYASLGTLENGASMAEVAKRASLPDKAAESLLLEMKEQKLVEERDGRYFPLSPHFFYEGADQDKLFQQRYLEILNRVKVKASRSLKSEDSLFLCSTISVSSKELSRFKNELREFLNNFVQDAENPEGDTLAHILVGMIS